MEKNEIDDIKQLCLRSVHEDIAKVYLSIISYLVS